MRKRRQGTRREPTIALINIVFLMLVFFMVAGTLSTPLDKDVPLVRIRLVTDSAGFALILTMSHAIGDGATLYQIHKQFSDGAVAMDATRKNKDFYPTIDCGNLQLCSFAGISETSPRPWPSTWQYTRASMTREANSRRAVRPRTYEKKREKPVTKN